MPNEKDNNEESEPTQIKDVSVSNGADCSRIHARKDKPIVYSSWGYESEQDDHYLDPDGLDDNDDTTDLAECGMRYDDGHNFACELIGSEQCEFCPNRR